MVHVGRGDRWCAHIVAERSGDYIDPRAVPGASPDWPGRRNRVAAGRSARAARCGEGDGSPDAGGTFLGPRPAQWWIRRRLHETAVHRADAALALGAGFDLDPDLAADGITEYLGAW